MGHVEVVWVGHVLPDGRELFADVSFRVGDGAKAALVGANGAGKTTLLRIVAGDLQPAAGSVIRSGGLGVMRQFIGSVRDATTVQDFLVRLSGPAVADAWDAVWSNFTAAVGNTVGQYQAALASDATYLTSAQGLMFEVRPGRGWEGGRWWCRPDYEARSGAGSRGE